MKPGDVIAARFELLALARSGGMGTVYRARDRLSGETVALKVLARNSFAAEYAERFLREANVLSELQHPGIVRYVAHGAAPTGAPWLAMEWLEGEDLGDRLARGPLGIEGSVRMIRKVASALTTAHRRGIVHRDIKPQNLFLVGGDIDRVKILDFGIARLRRLATTLTATGEVIGTPMYMAPEQARAASEIDPRVDVFALGCVLYECISHHAPFGGPSASAVLAKILFEEPALLSSLVPEASAELDALLAHMLRKDPAGRLADAEAIVESIDALGPLGRMSRPPTSLAATSLTGREQQLWCVILAQAISKPTRFDTVDEAPIEEQATDQFVAAPDRLAQLVERHGGEIELLADGSAVVKFSWTGALDRAAHAARCVLAMRALVGGAPLALATGKSEAHGRIALGEVIDRAARLLVPSVGVAADVNDVRIDEVTAALLDERFEVLRDTGGLVLRGTRAADRGGRTLLGKPSSFVGRERELRTLTAIYDGCVSTPAASAVSITGAAGIGKSRLRQEIVDRLRTLETGAPEILIARGDPSAAGSPFGMIVPVVRRAFGIAEGEPAAEQRKKLQARLDTRIETHADRVRIAQFLGELIGATDDPVHGDEQLVAARRDPQLMGDQMRRAFLEWLGAECALKPVVLVLEDLQWGDLPSVQFVDAALHELAEKPLLVLAFARPEVDELFPKLWGDRASQSMRLSELPRKAAERLAREALGEGASDATIGRVVERAGGNAYFLEELIRAVAAGREDELPPTLLAIVQARVALLEPEARRILRAASIFGRVFWRGGVRALLGEAASAEVDDWLAELTSRELILERNPARFVGDEEYVFRNAPVAEVAYEMLTADDRRLGHRLAAEWLESVSESDAVLLAGHFVRGDVPQRAIECYRRAAEHALEGNDLTAALERIEKGVQCGASGETLGALRQLEATAHQWRGDVTASARVGELALHLLPRGSMQWARALEALVVARGRLRDRAGVERLLDELDVPWSPDETGQMHGYVLSRIIILFVLWQWVDRAQALIGSLPSRLPERLLEEPMMAGQLAIARAYLAVGADDDQGVAEHAARAVEHFDRAGNRRKAALHRIEAAYGQGNLGQYAQARRMLRQALAEGTSMQLPIVVDLAHHNLAYVLAVMGDVAEGVQMEEQAVAAYQKGGDVRMECASRCYLSAILFMQGQLESAVTQAKRALDLSEGNEALRPYALGNLARARLAQPDGVADALQVAAEASSLLESLEVVEAGDAQVRLVHAQALRASGRNGEALTAIVSARERLLARARTMTDPRFREGFLQGVPDHALTLALAHAWERA